MMKRTAKTRFLRMMMIASMSAALAACSSSKTTEGEQVPDMTADASAAGTDAVPPPEGAEVPPPVADDPLAATSHPETAPADGQAHAEAPAVPEAEPTHASTETALAAPPEADPTAQPAPPATSGETAHVAPTPAESAAPSGPTMSAAEGTEDYTVQSGDTLMKIAFDRYGDLFKWRQIYESNRDRIANPNSVPPGTVLRLESGSSPQIARNGEKYLIKSGDTLGTISDDVYGTKRKWRRIWDNNRELIKDPNRIFAGFTLYYTMTQEDREELEHLRSPAKPLAQSEPERGVASN